MSTLPRESGKASKKLNSVSIVLNQGVVKLVKEGVEHWHGLNGCI